MRYAGAALILLDMLDETIVPELHGATESIAAHRQSTLKGKGLFFVAPGVTLTGAQSYKPHPKGRMVQRRVATSTSQRAERGSYIHLLWYSVLAGSVECVVSFGGK